MPLKVSRDPAQQIDQLIEIAQTSVREANALYVRSVFARDFGLEAPPLDGQAERLAFTAKGLELVGLDLLTRHTHDPAVVKRAWQELLTSAYRLRRTAVSGGNAGLRDLVDEVIDGVLANRQPEIRLNLQSILLGQPDGAAEVTPWNKYLERQILSAFLLLVRKQNGYSDLSTALSIIANLKARQPLAENQYLETFSEDDQVALWNAAATVVALYHLSRVVEITGEYLSGHYEKNARNRLAAQGVKDELDRFAFSARELLLGRDSGLRLLVGRMTEGCKALVDASVYTPVMPRKPRELLLQLAKRDRPVLELWYSQREALRQSLLDPTRLAIVVSMPTSAGKTLLAELVILQAYNDNPEERIVYLAPTRALVTQASLTLRRDLGLEVRVATPSFELDPVEDEILDGDYPILVTTPEKLDLLVRTDHPSVQQISLVVVDEAHNINDGERGARLELLLATLRRERSGTRFLLVTPFATNASELARWLAGQEGTPIVLDWKPNDRVVGALLPGSRSSNGLRRMKFLTLDSVHSDCPAGVEILLGEAPATIGKRKEDLAIHAVAKWAGAKDGGILLLASSRKNAEERAKSLAALLPSPERVPASVDVVCRYLDTEAGGAHPLSALLRRGVAFHHAGLSTEARYFVERLVEEGSVKLICATTTLAQGVHFPLSVAVVESIYRFVTIGTHGFNKLMAPWEFWNIAGRVGRTLEDPLGTIAFATTDEAQRNGIQGFLTKEANIVSSTLLEMLRVLRDRPNISFDTYLINNFRAASAFLQYIVHAIAVSDKDTVARDLEGILRASFVYQQARSDPDLADELIRLARLYLDHLSRKGRRLQGFATIADGTGFSSPSVDIILSEWKGEQAPRQNPVEWDGQNVFPTEGSASPILTRVVDTLKRIPEVRLGTENEGKFSSERIARITAAWVSGMPLGDLANLEYGGDLLKCAHHVYGTIVSAVPWGLRAIEKVVFAGQPNEVWEQLDMLPAMVFHGVRTREAVAMRMLSVPRIAAEGLAIQYRTAGLQSAARASEWLGQTSEDHWQHALPPASRISGRECRLLWEVLEGRKTWKEAFRHDV